MNERWNRSLRTTAHNRTRALSECQTRLRGKFLRCHAVPRHRQRSMRRLFVHCAKPDLRTTSSSPGALRRDEYSGRAGEQFRLLLGPHEDDAPFPISPERGKNLPAYSEIRVIHMRALGRFGKTEGEIAEFVSRHFFHRLLAAPAAAAKACRATYPTLEYDPRWHARTRARAGCGPGN